MRPLQRLATASIALAAFLATTPLAGWGFEFHFTPPADSKATSGSKVAVTGDFAGWEPEGKPMARKDDGSYSADVPLADGRHLYKFTVEAGNSGWFADPANPAKEDDGNGGFNSILVLKDGKAVDAPADAPKPSADSGPRAGRVAPPAASRDSANDPWWSTKRAIEGIAEGGSPLPPADGAPLASWIAVKFENGALRPDYDHMRSATPEPAQGRRAARKAAKQDAAFTKPDGHGTLLLSRDLLALPGGEDASTSPPCAARRVFVWLPPGYTESRRREYPVIYLHDGQNVWDDASCCFGHGGWNVNTYLEAHGDAALAGKEAKAARQEDKAAGKGKGKGRHRKAALADLMTSASSAGDDSAPLPQAILVGIPNSAPRVAEYGLGSDCVALADTPYLKFLREVVKPRVDRDFRTLSGPASTTLMGSSMGGVISLYGVWHDPQVWGTAIAMSTAFQVPDSKKHTFLDLLTAKGPGKFRLYLDNGTGGQAQDGAPRTRKFAEEAKKAGWKQLVHREFEGEEHNEGAWRKRIGVPLHYALGH